MDAVTSQDCEFEDVDMEQETGSDPSDGEDEEYDPLHAILEYRRLYESQARNRGLGGYWGGGMWAAVSGSVGAALRLLAPAALLTLLWGHDSFIFRLLHHCDRTLKSVFSSSGGQTDDVLAWLQQALPGDVRAQSLDAVWAGGGVLCDLVDGAVPGSCGGHGGPADLAHGQRLAEQYLGVRPIFSQHELSQRVLSTYQECRLTHYLTCIKEAIGRISPAVSRVGSPILNVQAYTLDYVARGMGLITASKGRKTNFYLYPTAQQGVEPGDISVQIKGPGDCYGSVLVPVIYGRAHVIRNVLFNLGQRKCTMPLPLPIIQGCSYMRTFDQNKVENNYFIPKIKNDIDVSITIRHDRVKVSYTPSTDGFHELTLISKGCHIMGSPFGINIERGSVERQNSYEYEDEDAMDETLKSERKIVFRIVDFVTEKMLLTDDGRLEKISDKDAEALLHSSKSLENLNKSLQQNKILPGPDLIHYKNTHNCDLYGLKRNFKLIVKNVIVMLQVCKEFERNHKYGVEDISALKSYSSTPDIVNSTINDCLPKFNKDKIGHAYSTDDRVSAGELRKQFKKQYPSFNKTADIYDLDISEYSMESELNSKTFIDNFNTPADVSFEKEEDRFYSKAPLIEIIISSFDDDENESLLDLIPPEAEPVFDEFLERSKTPVLITKEESIKEDAHKTIVAEDSPQRGKSPKIKFLIEKDEKSAKLIKELPNRPKTPVLKLLENDEETEPEEAIPHRPKTPAFKIFGSLEEYAMASKEELFPERPITPVCKVLEASESGRNFYNEFDHYQFEDQVFDSLGGFIDSFCEETNNALNNKHFEKEICTDDGKVSPSINFRIGEPVTPTCMMNPPIIEADMDSIIEASNLEEALVKYDKKVQKTIQDIEHYSSDDSGSLNFATPIPPTPFEDMTDSQILRMYEEPLSLKEAIESQECIEVETFESLEADQKGIKELDLNDIKIDGAACVNDPLPVLRNHASVSSQHNEDIVYLNGSRNNSIDTWDSAYISIDELNSSPDSNNTTPRSDFSPRGKLFSIEENENEFSFLGKCKDNNVINLEQLASMGPAEREIWKNITESEAKKEKVFNSGSNNCNGADFVDKLYPKIIQSGNQITPIDENEISEISKTKNIEEDDTQNSNFHKRSKYCDSSGENQKYTGEVFLNYKTSEGISEQLFLKRDSWKHHKVSENKKDKKKSEYLKFKAESDDSASDFNADVNGSDNGDAAKGKTSKRKDKRRLISLVQTPDAEQQAGNLNLVQKEFDIFQNLIKGKSTDTLSENFERQISPPASPSGSKGVSKMVSDKKEYWDDKIKAMEKSEEMKHRSILKKKTAVIRRNDSLSKKRNTQVIAKLPSINEKWKQCFDANLENNQIEESICQGKTSFVAKWKEYWNEKVEKSNSPTGEIMNRTNSGTSTDKSNSKINLESVLNEPEDIMEQIVCDNINYQINNRCAFLGKSDEKNHNSCVSTSFKADKPKEMDIFKSKYQPKPISLVKLSERIDRFLDSMSTLSPIVDCDESSFSTPEPQFGGFVCRRMNSLSSNNSSIDKDDSSSLLKIQKDEHRLVVTWNGHASEQRMQALKDISNSTTPDIQSFYESKQQNYDTKLSLIDMNKENSEIISQISLSDNFTHNKIDKDIEIEDTDGFPGVAGLKAKIENLKQIKEARETFLSSKSKTFDLPQIKNINCLKKYFSLENIDRNVNTNKTNLVSKMSQSNSSMSGQGKYEDIDKSLATSTDSIPSISERKARIELHLQKRLSTPRNDSETKIDANEIKYNRTQTAAAKSHVKEIMGNHERFDSKIEEVMKSTKPIGDILAVFENRTTPLNSKNILKKQTLMENATSKSPENLGAFCRNSKRTASSMQFLQSDAVYREGTTVEYKKASQPTIEDEILPINEEKNNQDASEIHAAISKNNCNGIKSENIMSNEPKEDEHIKSSKYKERFKKTKMFFQTLEEIKKLNEEYIEKKPNECEKLLFDLTLKQNSKDKLKMKNKSTEDKENEKLINANQNTNKKLAKKAFSAPTSDTETELRMNEFKSEDNNRLMKISEKFLIEDFFQDVAGESNITAVGRFKGIPHKNAVLAAFRSVENVSQQSSYEYTISQMEEFAKKNGIVNSQTYHSEFPHLPITQSGKYRARCDAAASGLIRSKDLQRFKKPRRNSAPESVEMKLTFYANV